jgi:peptide/nickel transport system substrate-binding protein
VEIWHPSTSANRSLAAQTLKSLADREMGGLLQIEVNNVESTTFFKDISRGLYPAALLDWYPDFLDPDNYVYPFLSCQKGSQAQGCQNGGSQSQGSFYYSQTMNKLIARQRQEQNPAAREAILRQIQEQVAKDVPYIPLWQTKDYIFAHNGVNNVQLDPTQNLIYRNISKQ